MSKQISFDIGIEDAQLVRKIASRAVERIAHDWKVSEIDIVMDLTAVHANGCPLRLAELLSADDFNFLHDIGGIRKHLDRTTGKLGNFFTPRFAGVAK